MKIKKKKSFPLSQVYKLIEPGPVVMITTAMRDKPNVMTMSWHMMVDFEPPLIACVMSNRNYSFEILRKSKECVINIPTVELAKKVVACGNSSGRNIDKFKKFGLTTSPAKNVHSPLVNECYANLECKVVDTKMANKYNIFICEVVQAWINPSQKNPRTIHHQGNGKFVIDGRIIQVRSRMK
jgi:flavin reductase (DIM6/NTAB) family NADH-FMN oxidoreductase RutF